MQRLHLSKDIQTVYRQGVKHYHPFFRIFTLATQRPDSRATVVVSTRVSKKAVDRNRIKRRLRPLLHKHLTRTASAHDIVVIVQQRALTATTAELTQAVRSVV